MSSLFNSVSPLEAAGIGKLEGLINQGLQLDPGTQQALIPLTAKSLLVQCTFPLRTLHISFTAPLDDSPAVPALTLRLISTANTEQPIADVSLKGNAINLALLLAKGAEAVTFANSGVSIDGNIDILQQLSAIISRLDIDWEQAMAHVMGDVPAHLAGQAVRGAMKFHHRAAQRAATGASSFIRDESGLTLNNHEIKPWLRQVRELANDTDRLGARIQRLATTMEK